MANKKEYKKGSPVELIMAMPLSQKKNWISHSSHIIEYKIKYASIDKFHSTIKEAVQINYRWKGEIFTAYVHYKDLVILDELPDLIVSKPVMFDENNLDI